MNKKFTFKLFSLIGVMMIILFIPQNVVWGGFNFQTVPTLPPTATSTSTATLTPTTTLTVTSTITSTNTSIPPTSTFTITSTQPVLVTPTFTITPEIIVEPSLPNWINYIILVIVSTIAIVTGVIGYMLFIRKKKPSNQ